MSELRILLEKVSGRFDALSREIADASADIARYAAGTTTAAPFTRHGRPAAAGLPKPEPQRAVACARCGNLQNPTTRFCTRCGTAVAAATAAPARARAGEAPRAGVRGTAAPGRSAGPRWTLSEVFALRALGWLAGAVTLLGIVFLYALAEQRGWVGPGARVGFGVAVSAALLCAAFLLHAPGTATSSRRWPPPVRPSRASTSRSLRRSRCITSFPRPPGFRSRLRSPGWPSRSRGGGRQSRWPCSALPARWSRRRCPSTPSRRSAMVPRRRPGGRSCGPRGSGATGCGSSASPRASRSSRRSS